MTYHYRLFGLSFASQVEIAGLDPASTPPVDRPDVQIRCDTLPEMEGAQEFLSMRVGCSDGALAFEAPAIARFRVRDGEEIVVAPCCDDPARARDYLLGTAMGALLHQRGYLPLHANVMEWNGRAYAFAGASRAGKSTLAARLHARGYGFLSDDVCAVSWDAEGRPRAWPGIPRVKLWRDAVRALSLDEAGMRPLTWTTEKFEAAVDDQVGEGSLPLAAVYDLRRASDEASHGLFRLSGVDAVNSIVAHTYRRRLVDFQGLSAAYLERVLGLARSVPVLAVRRRWGFDAFEQELSSIHASVLEVEAGLCGAAETARLGR